MLADAEEVAVEVQARVAEVLERSCVAEGLQAAVVVSQELLFPPLMFKRSVSKEKDLAPWARSLK